MAVLCVRREYFLVCLTQGTTFHGGAVCSQVIFFSLLDAGNCPSRAVLRDRRELFLFA